MKIKVALLALSFCSGVNSTGRTIKRPVNAEGRVDLIQKERKEKLCHGLLMSQGIPSSSAHCICTGNTQDLIDEDYSREETLEQIRHNVRKYIDNHDKYNQEHRGSLLNVRDAAMDEVAKLIKGNEWINCSKCCYLEVTEVHTKEAEAAFTKIHIQ